MERNGCLSVIITFILALIAFLTLYYWFYLRETPDLPEVDRDDAGNYSFVRQIVPLLQGRKIKGYDEIKVLADLVAATDRATVIEMVTLHNESYASEYRENWADIMVDWFRVHRETPKNQQSCFAPPLHSPVSHEIAEHIFTQAPTNSGPVANYNMSDVLLSSLEYDNIAPAYLAYLFPFVNKPISGAEVTEQNKRTDLGSGFTQIYSNRQMTCLGCHTSITSETGPESFWNRHYPIFGNFEKAVFGSSTGRNSNEVEALLRTDVRSGGSTRPWGMDNCGSFRTAGSVSTDSLTYPDSTTPLSAFLVENQGSQASVWALEGILRDGIHTLAAEGLQRGPDASIQATCTTCETSCSGDAPIDDPAALAREAAVDTIVENICSDCHSSWDGGSWTTLWIDDGLIVPGNSASSLVAQRINGIGGIMPPSSYSPSPISGTQIGDIEAWIDGLGGTPADCSICSSLTCDENSLNGRAAFAFLVAENTVSQIWSELFGSKLTIPNYFSRNAGQGAVLWNLTEDVFIPNNWSLQSVLKQSLTSEYFNRKPPLSSTEVYAFSQPLFYDPWVEADPRVPPIAEPGWEPGDTSAPTRDPNYSADTNAEKAGHKNAMTEAIHRYTPRSLLYSVHRGMGWPASERFGSTQYPSTSFRKTLGQFWRDAEPGFKEVDLQGLLRWEDEVGRCEKPSNHSGDDWIDRLLTSAGTYNTSNPGAELNYRDYAIALKDWLHGYGHIQTDISETPQGVTQTEHQLLTALFGDLATKPDPSEAQLENNLRSYCGALLTSPQYLLAGIAPTDLGEKPRVRVCSDDGEPCSYLQICTSFSTAVEQYGYTLNCNATTLNVNIPAATLSLRDFCKHGFCGFERFRDVDCMKSPLGCITPEPPCDPSCATIDCCGGPLPPMDMPSYMVADAASAIIEESQNIEIRVKGRQEFTILEPGTRLQAGDLLRINQKGKLHIQTNGQTYKTPRGGLPENGSMKSWYLLVDDSKERSAYAVPKQLKSVPEAFINKALKDEWYRYGEAGGPTLGGQEQELDMERMLQFERGKAKEVPGEEVLQ